MEKEKLQKLIRDEIKAALAVHKYEDHKRRSSGTFTPPSREEIVAYCTEHRICLDVEKFIDFYDSNGWKVGRNPMKSWEKTVCRAAREWCRDVNATWLREKKVVSKDAPVNVISVEERIALREKMQGIGKPVPKIETTATRAMLDRLNEPAPAPSGPMKEWDLPMDPAADERR